MKKQLYCLFWLTKIDIDEIFISLSFAPAQSLTFIFQFTQFPLPQLHSSCEWLLSNGILSVSLPLCIYHFFTLLYRTVFLKKKIILNGISEIRDFTRSENWQAVKVCVKNTHIHIAIYCSNCNSMLKWDSLGIKT